MTSQQDTELLEILTTYAIEVRNSNTSIGKRVAIQTLTSWKDKEVESAVQKAPSRETVEALVKAHCSAAFNYASAIHNGDNKYTGATVTAAENELNQVERSLVNLLRYGESLQSQGGK